MSAAVLVSARLSHLCAEEGSLLIVRWTELWADRGQVIVALGRYRTLIPQGAFGGGGDALPSIA